MAAGTDFQTSQKRLVALTLGFCSTLTLVGCQTLGQSQAHKLDVQPALLASGPTHQIQPVALWPWSKDKKDDEYGRVRNDVAGPLQRLAMSKQEHAPQTQLDREHMADVKRARVLFDDAKYDEAIAIFQSVQKQRDPDRFNWSKLFTLGNDDRPVYDPIRAEALFYQGEAYFMLKNLRRARDNYKVIVKDYPSTAYVDRSTRRLFEIAKQWLGDHEFATSSELTQVNLEEPSRKPISTAPIAPHRWYHLNPWDKARPVLDTNGYAIDALRTIWTYDSSGPLADDALMLAATHYLRENDNVEADRLFTLLREQFPKSPHLQNAFVLGSHVKLASYQGSAYEEETLEDARDLKESILRLYPNAPESDRIREELKAIRDAEARRVYDRAEFWRKKGKPKAEAIYLQQLVDNFPETQIAQQGRTRLSQLGTAGESQPTTLRSVLPKADSIVRPFRSESSDETPEESSESKQKPTENTPRELNSEQSRGAPARRLWGLLPGKD